jgi:Tfp pilus assembly protein FimT
MVLLIIMVLSVGAVGGYLRFRESRAIKTGAENLMAAFAAARSFAISTNSPHRLVIETRDPVTGAERVSYWVDEIFPGSSDEPFPTLPDQARTPRVTTPEFLPEGVRLYDITSRDITATADSINYAVIRFFRDGSTDGARLRLIDSNIPTEAQARRVATVRLFPATGQRTLRMEVR